MVQVAQGSDYCNCTIPVTITRSADTDAVGVHAWTYVDKSYCTIAGGVENVVSSSYGVIAGGHQNAAMDSRYVFDTHLVPYHLEMNSS